MELNYLLKILLPLLLGGFISLILTPLVIKFALKFKLVDIPSKRKIHNKPIPRIGGFVIYFSTLISFIFLSIFDLNILNINYFTIINNENVIIAFAIITLFFVIGFLDDIFSLSPFLRLILQFLFSFFAWLKGIRIETIYISLNDINFTLSPIFSLIITSTWLVGIVNAINWIDGCDGLAIGVNIIIYINLIIYSFVKGNYEFIIFLSTILGASLSFYKFNKYPARIIMGDSGSYFFGSSLAIFSLLLFKNNLISNGDVIGFNIIIPLLLISLPVADMFLVILSRLISNKSPFFPDKSHLHHKLMSIGFSQKKTVEYIYLLVLITNLIGLIFYIYE